MSQLQGSIAVYALNFSQPAADYMKFRTRITEKNVSLENVVLNRFTLTGTIKVKNISYSKQVFVRCSFNKWQSFEDHQATFVLNEPYSSGGQTVGDGSGSGTGVMSSPTSSSLSATFYSVHRPDYQPKHKDFDTFRFEFQLPKTAAAESGAPATNDPKSIQFCVCYRTDNGGESWDNNDGSNYEILQYIIDVEKLKPGSSKAPSSRHHHHHHHHRSSSSSGSKSSYMSSTSSSPLSGEVYY
jgi:protein phosphatase 1 regulatory subunit 3A/B/C/D/E